MFVMSNIGDYDKYDGLGLAELVKKKHVKPAELLEEAISRVERLNPQLNAVVHKMYEQARQTAEEDLPDGPFSGVPFLLKDLLMSYAGVPLTNGSRFFKDFVPDHDSEMVRRFKRAGLVILGKTNTPELGLAPVTEPELFGPANNPWDMTRTTGGSSGGSAASVAARIVPLAHGSDGGGSIRMPASCCGVFGLKPTRGRNPTGPDYGELWRGFHCEHVITRSVRDSAAVLDAVSGPDTGAPYWVAPPERPFLEEVNKDPGKLRIAYTSESFLGNEVDTDCVKGLESTVKLCAELGHDLEEVVFPIDGKAVVGHFLKLICAEIKAFVDDAAVNIGKKPAYRYFEPVTWVIYLLGGQSAASEYSQALNLAQRVGRQIGEFFTEYDILLTPVLARPPLLTGELQPKGFQAVTMKVLGRFNAGWIIDKFVDIDALATEFFSFMPFTPLFNATGQPAMSVPLYWNDEGLPIGMQFAGRYGDEATLFRLAGQLEKARPWADRIPPVCARASV
jgi:amidase